MKDALLISSGEAEVSILGNSFVVWEEAATGAAGRKEEDVKYAILIYGDESAQAQLTPEKIEEQMGLWWGYEAELQKEPGLRLAGEALQPTPTATTVRLKDGKRVTTDGPFAETKEQLGGFYLIDVKDLDEALVWAEKCPGAMFGSIEVRAVQEFQPPEQ